MSAVDTVAEQPQVLAKVKPVNKREPIFHRLAHKVEAGQTCTAALREHTLDYRIFRATPAGFRIDKEELAQASYPDLNPADQDIYIDLLTADLQTGGKGQPPVPYLRERTPHNTDSLLYLFSASKGYGLVQNGDIASVIDALAGQTGWRVDTVGDLDGGLRFVASLDAGEGTIAGEAYRSHFVISDERGGDGGLQVMYVPERVYCANAISWAWRQATNRIRLIHTPSIRDDLATVAEMFVQLRDSKAELDEHLESLAATQITDEEAQEIIDAAITAPRPPRTPLRDRQQMPEVAIDLSRGDVGRAARQAKKLADSWERYERAKANYDVSQATARQLYVKFNAEFPRLARTPYAVVQAVAELLDHGPGGNRGARAALLGEQRAFDRALSLA